MTTARVATCVAGLMLLAVAAKLQAEDGKAAPDKRAELIAAAKAAYKGADFDFRQNRCVVDEVYVWSKRLRDAEQGVNANAAADHAERMGALHAHVQEMFNTNPAFVGRSLLATKYYVAEADVDQGAK
jgi:hypothetical protein